MFNHEAPPLRGTKCRGNLFLHLFLLDCFAYARNDNKKESLDTLEMTALENER